MTHDQMLAKIERYKGDIQAAIDDAVKLIREIAVGPYRDEGEQRQAELAACGIALVALQNQKQGVSPLGVSNGISNILCTLYTLGFRDGIAHATSAELRKLVEGTQK